MAVRRVGTCRIVRELGRGGMGVVYEAVQEGLDRRVAVKALDGKLSGRAELVERFRREGRAYAQLRHQAVVAVHDLVEKDDALYLVTEFVDGPDLARVLRQGGALPPDCVAIVGARMAEALDYIHFHKLFHRDVKPANIMVSNDGDLKLVDFGIAKDQTADDLTREGVVVGSPAYMPAEVLNGEEADARADIWALGVTLYELAAARRPFEAATTESLVQAVRAGSFPRLRSLVPGMSRRLARAIEGCLRKRARDRWADAGALAAELERCSVQALKGLNPRARLVGLLTHRGFMAQEQALTRIGSRSLLASLVIDEATAPLEEARRPWRWAWALFALLALGAGAAAVWARYRGLL